MSAQVDASNHDIISQTIYITIYVTTAPTLRHLLASLTPSLSINGTTTLRY